jgi:hypothetical protein
VPQFNPALLSRRPFGQNYAFVVVAAIFLALLSSAGLRATPGVLMLPLQTAFGWNVGVISSSARRGVRNALTSMRPTAFLG